MKYVVGFVFDPQRQQVMLIKKNRPSSQAGLLNGIGGKVEGQLEDLNPAIAMVREAREESGYESGPNDWYLFHNELHTSGSDLYFFVTSTSNLAAQVQTKTDEVIVLASYDVDAHGNFLRVNFDHRQMMYNLGWLLPMAYCYLRYPEHRYIRG